ASPWAKRWRICIIWWARDDSCAKLAPTASTASARFNSASDRPLARLAFADRRHPRPLIDDLEHGGNGDRAERGQRELVDLVEHDGEDPRPNTSVGRGSSPSTPSDPIGSNSSITSISA